MAATNKCLAESNNFHTGGKVTKKREALYQPVPAVFLCRGLNPCARSRRLALTGRPAAPA